MGRHDQRVEGLEVHRIGDVDDDLAGELVGVLFENVFQGRMRDGQDDNVAAHWTRRVGAANVVDRGAARG